MGSANDMKEATKTYNSFIASLKWSVPLVAVITAIVIVMIAS